MSEYKKSQHCPFPPFCEQIAQALNKGDVETVYHLLFSPEGAGHSDELGIEIGRNMGTCKHNSTEDAPCLLGPTQFQQRTPDDNPDWTAESQFALYFTHLIPYLQTLQNEALQGKTT